MDNIESKGPYCRNGSIISPTTPKPSNSLQIKNTRSSVILHCIPKSEACLKLSKNPPKDKQYDIDCNNYCIVGDHRDSQTTAMYFDMQNHEHLQFTLITPMFIFKLDILLSHNKQKHVSMALKLSSGKTKAIKKLKLMM